MKNALLRALLALVSITGCGEVTYQDGSFPDTGWATVKLRTGLAFDLLRGRGKVDAATSWSVAGR